MSVKSMLRNRVQVQRKHALPDGHGGSFPNWTIRYPEYRCHLYARSGGLVRSELGEIDAYTHRFIGRDADIRAGDRFVDLDSKDMLVVMEVQKMNGRYPTVQGRLRKVAQDAIEMEGGFGTGPAGG